MKCEHHANWMCARNIFRLRNFHLLFRHQALKLQHANFKNFSFFFFQDGIVPYYPKHHLNQQFLFVVHENKKEKEK